MSKPVAAPKSVAGNKLHSSTSIPVYHCYVQFSLSALSCMCVVCGALMFITVKKAVICSTINRAEH